MTAPDRESTMAAIRETEEDDTGGDPCPGCGAARAWYHAQGWDYAWLLHRTNRWCPHNERPLCPRKQVDVAAHDELAERVRELEEGQR